MMQEVVAEVPKRTLPRLTNERQEVGLSRQAAFNLYLGESRHSHFDRRSV